MHKHRIRPMHQHRPYVARSKLCDDIIGIIIANCRSKHKFASFSSPCTGLAGKQTGRNSLLGETVNGEDGCETVTKLMSLPKGWRRRQCGGKYVSGCANIIFRYERSVSQDDIRLKTKQRKHIRLDQRQFIGYIEPHEGEILDLIFIQ